MPNPVVHFEISGKDDKALRKFYASAFDWKVEAMPDGGAGISYAMVHPGVEYGIDGGIGGVPNDGYPGHVTFYVEVERLEDALKKIEQLGGKTMMPPMDVPGGPRIALFFDPEGHTVGLVQRGSMRSS